MMVFYTHLYKVTSDNCAKAKERLLCAKLMNIKGGDIHF